MLEATNEAKVSLILDINNALKSIEILQKRLDSLSINNLQIESVKEGIEVVGNTLVKTGDKALDVRKRLRLLKKEIENYSYGKINYKSDPKYIALQQEISDLENFLQAVHNKSKVIPVKSVLGIGAVEEYKKYAEEAMKAEMQITNTALNYRQEQITAYKKYQADANNIRQKSESTYSLKQEVEATEALLKHQQSVKENYKHFNSIIDSVKEKPIVNYSLAKEVEATEELIKYQQQTIANYKRFNEVAKLTSKPVSEIKNTMNEFKSYSAELSKLEKAGAKAYHSMVNATDSNAREKYRLELERIRIEYEKLNRESVSFRKQLGVSQTRGIYDLNHNLDYFRAKVRSRLVYSFATELDNLLMTAPTRFINALSTYQQNRVNFAQVMPDSIGNNQEAMNRVMKEFTQIASDYGTAVNEVVEAGRLWGRQYKDVAIVQELVRNSTKLSITDNMSLTEVNKGLEATMQQYNIHLKDANEAQQVSGKIVDTWAKLADNAVVTAQDLAKANERSAGAAYQAGVGFDYLQAMIATMSSATGKAGGEIGRSIRSMLISMRSAKAEKEFAKLGIATTELVNGEKRIRSFEKVITELMQKLKTSPKDVYALINAMAGGKYQFNNVMALLKNYDEFTKNLATARNSQGWADEQVALQYQTISRQIKALNADLEQLIRVLDEAGASNGVSSLIQMLREIVQLLQKIDPSTYKTVGQVIGAFVSYKALVTIAKYVNSFRFAFAEAIKVLASSIGIIKGVWLGVLKLGTGLKLLAGMSSVLGIVGAIGSILYNIVEATSDLNIDSIKQFNNEIAKSADMLVNEAGQYQTHETAIRKYIQQIKDSKAILDSTTASQEDKDRANKTLSESERILTSIIGESAKKRLESAGFTSEAIDSEIQDYIRLQIVSDSALQSRIQNEILLTESVLENSQLRINAYQREIDSMYSESQEKFNKAKKEYEDYVNNYQGDKDSIAHKAKLIDLQNALDEAKEIQDNLYKKIVQKANYQNQYDKAQSNLNRLKALADGIIIRNPQNDIVGVVGGTLDEETKSIGKSYTEQTIRNQLERERNQLWLQSKIEAQAYENALKSITNLEQAYGSTEYSINQKTSLFTSRKADLEDYQQKLENFRDVLISVVDQEMQGNQKVAEMVGYKSDMTLKDKLQHFEVNKELYQQEKTYSAIINLISSVNAEIEKTKGKTQEVTNSLMQQEKSLYNVRVDEINRKYQLEDIMLNRPTNYNYETQKVRLQIEQEKELIAEKNSYIDTLNKQLIQAIKDNDIDKIKAIRHNITTEILLREQQYQKLAELENQKNYNIRNGLAEVTQSFLIEGNSLRDIWKNLWQDLAREAIQRLFQIKATSSILGSLFGLFGGSPNVFTNDELDPMKIAGYKAHTGASIGTYPKMHTGGVVANGRIGVVPKLQNNEVIRTLQVGEEVNSLQDRRSNEMLTAIVLKALDGQNNRPNNFNIFAMDSRSFAEYLNDNADILTAVLAKQGAMGRR